eukprot:TRINITY_DN1544_c2_g1_i2.p1 TRINITY_DN1544_c2_g1~~TRINITY_DN1544_c2_g1_i2.p1  ORF type:complete len:1964 (-),score=564.59 TRINITY_DN1544_c2_g1_i2:368-5740(-)
MGEGERKHINLKFVPQMSGTYIAELYILEEFYQEVPFEIDLEHKSKSEAETINDLSNSQKLTSAVQDTISVEIQLDGLNRNEEVAVELYDPLGKMIPCNFEVEKVFDDSIDLPSLLHFKPTVSTGRYIAKVFSTDGKFITEVPIDINQSHIEEHSSPHRHDDDEEENKQKEQVVDGGSSSSGSSSSSSDIVQILSNTKKVLFPVGVLNLPLNMLKITVANESEVIGAGKFVKVHSEGDVSPKDDDEVAVEIETPSHVGNYYLHIDLDEKPLAGTPVLFRVVHPVGDHPVEEDSTNEQTPEENDSIKETEENPSIPNRQIDQVGSDEKVEDVKTGKEEEVIEVSSTPSVPDKLKDKPQEEEQQKEEVEVVEEEKVKTVPTIVEYNLEEITIASKEYTFFLEGKSANFVVTLKQTDLLGEFPPLDVLKFTLLQRLSNGEDSKELDVHYEFQNAASPNELESKISFTPSTHGNFVLTLSIIESETIKSSTTLHPSLNIYVTENNLTLPPIEGLQRLGEKAEVKVSLLKHLSITEDNYHVFDNFSCEVRKIDDHNDDIGDDDIRGHGFIVPSLLSPSLESLDDATISFIPLKSEVYHIIFIYSGVVVRCLRVHTQFSIEPTLSIQKLSPVDTKNFPKCDQSDIVGICSIILRAANVPSNERNIALKLETSLGGIPLPIKKTINHATDKESVYVQFDRPQLGKYKLVATIQPSIPVSYSKSSQNFSSFNIHSNAIDFEVNRPPKLEIIEPSITTTTTTTTNNGSNSLSRTSFGVKLSDFVLSTFSEVEFLIQSKSSDVGITSYPFEIDRKVIAGSYDKIVYLSFVPSVDCIDDKYQLVLIYQSILTEILPFNVTRTVLRKKASHKLEPGYIRRTLPKSVDEKLKSLQCVSVKFKIPPPPPVINDSSDCNLHCIGDIVEISDDSAGIEFLAIIPGIYKFVSGFTKDSKHEVELLEDLQSFDISVEQNELTSFVVGESSSLNLSSLVVDNGSNLTLGKYVQENINDVNYTITNPYSEKQSSSVSSSSTTNFEISSESIKLSNWIPNTVGLYQLSFTNSAQNTTIIGQEHSNTIQLCVNVGSIQIQTPIVHSSSSSTERKAEILVAAIKNRKGVKYNVQNKNHLDVLFIGDNKCDYNVEINPQDEARFIVVSLHDTSMKDFDKIKEFNVDLKFHGKSVFSAPVKVSFNAQAPPPPPPTHHPPSTVAATTESMEPKGITRVSSLTRSGSINIRLNSAKKAVSPTSSLSSSPSSSMSSVPSLPSLSSSSSLTSPHVSSSSIPILPPLNINTQTTIPSTTPSPSPPPTTTQPVTTTTKVASTSSTSNKSVSLANDDLATIKKKLKDSSQNRTSTLLIMSLKDETQKKIESIQLPDTFTTLTNVQLFRTQLAKSARPILQGASSTSSLPKPDSSHDRYVDELIDWFVDMLSNICTFYDVLKSNLGLIRSVQLREKIIDEFVQMKRPLMSLVSFMMKKLSSATAATAVTINDIGDQIKQIVVDGITQFKNIPTEESTNTPLSKPIQSIVTEQSIMSPRVHQPKPKPKSSSSSPPPSTSSKPSIPGLSLKSTTTPTEPLPVSTPKLNIGSSTTSTPSKPSVPGLGLSSSGNQSSSPSSTSGGITPRILKVNSLRGKTSSQSSKPTQTIYEKDPLSGIVVDSSNISNPQSLINQLIDFLNTPQSHQIEKQLICGSNPVPRNISEAAAGFTEVAKLLIVSIRSQPFTLPECLFAIIRSILYLRRIILDGFISETHWNEFVDCIDSFSEVCIKLFADRVVYRDYTQNIQTLSTVLSNIKSCLLSARS